MIKAIVSIAFFGIIALMWFSVYLIHIVDEMLEGME